MMRCRTILGLWLLLAVCPCDAQPPQPRPEPQIDSIVNSRAITQQTMCFRQSEIQLDDLCEDDTPVTVLFPFVNQGTGPLVITRVVTTCGCTTADYDRAPVLPGDSGTVRITFDPDEHPGTLLRKTFVYTNLSQTSPTAQLTLTGLVRPTADRWRDYPIRLGTLRARQQTVKFRLAQPSGKSAECIACANSSDKPLRLSVPELPAYLRFRTSPETIAPGAQADLVFLLDGMKLPAGTSGTVVIPAVLEGLEGAVGQRTIQVSITLQ